ncbi:MAG: ABC transporter ATP-binding protein [Oligoflexia bacterium]|nr:ABC transporter ATP-binding protein [Oligoflexia bacterium]
MWQKHFNKYSIRTRGYEGEVYFYGRPLREYSHATLREYMAIVPQKPFLFADTIKNNLLMGRQKCDEEIWHYLKIAGLEKDVLAMPDGIDTSLGEWGINLSGGQKQRLTLARALISAPKLLFLDDCLSAVDTVTEEQILRYLNEELKDTTLIWVAHRSSTLKYCNEILDLSQLPKTQTVNGALI